MRRRAMTRPVRLRLSRAKGFDLQVWSREVNGLPAADAAADKWGNPFTVIDAIDSGYASVATAPAFVVECFQDWLSPTRRCGRDWWQGPKSDASKAAILSSLAALRGKNLACWCGLCTKHAATGKPLDESCPDCAPCHADVLLELANAEAAP
jgi:hypothetical protein